MKHKSHSLPEAAVILRLSERQVRRYCVRGALGQKIGRNWIIGSDEIEAFVRAPKGRRPTSTPHGLGPASPSRGRIGSRSRPWRWG